MFPLTRATHSRYLFLTPSMLALGKLPQAAGTWAAFASAERRRARWHPLSRRKRKSGAHGSSLLLGGGGALCMISEPILGDPIAIFAHVVPG